MTAQTIAPATAEEVRRLCGELVDWKLSAILSLNPGFGDVEAAVAWAAGGADFGDEPHALQGVAAQVYDLLMSDEDYEGR